MIAIWESTGKGFGFPYRLLFISPVNHKQKHAVARTDVHRARLRENNRQQDDLPVYANTGLLIRTHELYKYIYWKTGVFYQELRRSRFRSIT